jgi:hypothetical protein
VRLITAGLADAIVEGRGAGAKATLEDVEAEKAGDAAPASGADAGSTELGTQKEMA